MIEEILEKEICKCNRFLIVDDDGFNLISVQNVLGKGQEYVCAYNGLQAVNIVKEYYTSPPCNIESCIPFKLIVMDYNMPEMHGDEAIEKIFEFLSSIGKPLIPTIVLTAYVEQEYRNKMIQLGASFFMNKPIKAPLLRRISAALCNGEQVDSNE